MEVLTLPSCRRRSPVHRYHACFSAGSTSTTMNTISMRSLRTCARLTTTWRCHDSSSTGTNTPSSSRVELTEYESNSVNRLAVSMAFSSLLSKGLTESCVASESTKIVLTMKLCKIPESIVDHTMARNKRRMIHTIYRIVESEHWNAGAIAPV